MTPSESFRTAVRHVQDGIRELNRNQVPQNEIAAVVAENVCSILLNLAARLT